MSLNEKEKKDHFAVSGQCSKVGFGIVTGFGDDVTHQSGDKKSLHVAAERGCPEQGGFWLGYDFVPLMVCIYWTAPSEAGTEKLLGKDTKLLHFNELKLQVRDAVSSWPWLHFDLPLRGREPGWSGVCCCFISLSVLCRTSPAVPRLLSEHAPGVAYCNSTGAFGFLFPSTCRQ